MSLTHLLHDHSLWLLATAIFFCVVGSIAGMTLWGHTMTTRGRARLDWGFLTSIVLGMTVWTTHFLSMLGYRVSEGASFDFSLTALSVLVAVFGMAGAIALTTLSSALLSEFAAGVTVGLAIAGMHFTGMYAFRIDGVPAAMRWPPESFLLGIVFGLLAVRLLVARAGEAGRPWAPALAFIAAVAGVHFSAMADFHENVGAMIVPGATSDHSGLAMVVALAGFTLLGTAITGFSIQQRLETSTEERLRSSARTDPLTGIANRGEFNRVLEEKCRQRLAGGAGFAVLLVDLDRFKSVNDGFGHQIGDVVLCRAVARLVRAIRAGDFAARLGGDEFAVIVADVAPGDAGTERIADRIIDLVSRPFLIGTRVVEIGASIGIAEPVSVEDAHPATLVRNADMALYSAKSEGRMAWRRFEPSIAIQFEERQTLEYDLRRAVARNEFELYFQPVVDSASGAFTGAEALIRWHHPTRGLLAPGAFVPMAEQLGLVNQIGRWVIENACQTAAKWRHPLNVSVNLSPVQLRDPRLVQVVQDALRVSGLPPERLDLEVTESALMEGEETGIWILSELRDLGISVSLDDFGTGFSSLSHLHKFPLNRIKIDRSFVSTAETDPKSAKIVEAIGFLGKVLGLGVTAEGVETEAQLELSSSKGCDVIQGYLISKPIPADELDDLIGRRMGMRQAAERTGT